MFNSNKQISIFSNSKWLLKVNNIKSHPQNYVQEKAKTATPVTVVRRHV